MKKDICPPCRLKNYISMVGMMIPDEFYATQNFSWKELLINQNETPTSEVLNNLLKVAQLLQLYREKYFKNSSITITSGWRSLNYNKKIGGAGKSYHINGMALDFTVNTYTPKQAQCILDKIHKGGLEYAPTWTHIDTRTQTIRFDNKNKIYKIGDYFK